MAVNGRNFGKEYLEGAVEMDFEPITAEEGAEEFSELHARFQAADRGGRLVLDHPLRKELIKAVGLLKDRIEAAVLKPEKELKRGLGIADEDTFFEYLDRGTVETHALADRVRSTLDTVRNAPDITALRGLLGPVTRIYEDLRVYKVAAHLATSAE